jgi:predicted dehydrogenase
MKQLRFALIGGGFMGKAHSVALANLPLYVWPLPLYPVRELIAEATDDLAEAARERFGFNRATSNWREAVQDPNVDAVSVLLPNHMHYEVVLAALRAGKHVICEKPLSPDLQQARVMTEAAEAAGVVHQVGFNWRLTPAVLLARKLVADGTIGEVRNFRGYWLGDFGDASLPMTWRFQRATAGSGALGDLGSHVIDWARFLVGEISHVVGLNRTYVKERALPNGGTGNVDVDDDTAFMMRFAGGAFGYIHASWACPGRKTSAGFEIHGSDGSLAFDWERMNEIRVYDSRDPRDRQGFKRVLIGPEQPEGEHFWPVAGYQIGYADTKVIQLLDFVRAVAGAGAVRTSFRDGLAAVAIEHAVQQSWEAGSWVGVEPTGVSKAAAVSNDKEVR